MSFALIAPWQILNHYQDDCYKKLSRYWKRLSVNNIVYLNLRQERGDKLQRVCVYSIRVGHASAISIGHVGIDS